MDDDKFVTFRLGTRDFHTLLSTVTTGRAHNSLLAAMVAGRYPVERGANGEYLLDNDQTKFAGVLEYLRTGRVVDPSDRVLRNELCYYGINIEAKQKIRLYIQHANLDLSGHYQCWIVKACQLSTNLSGVVDIVEIETPLYKLPWDIVSQIPFRPNFKKDETIPTASGDDLLFCLKEKSQRDDDFSSRHRRIWLSDLASIIEQHKDQSTVTVAMKRLVTNLDKQLERRVFYNGSGFTLRQAIVYSRQKFGETTLVIDIKMKSETFCDD